VTESTFSDDLWATGAATYEAILRHPFLTGLTDGSLPHEAFRYFIVQDSHYLRTYSRALALVAGRAHDDADVQMFAQHAANAVEVEQQMHAGLLDELGIGTAEIDAVEAGPTTTAYMSYLIAVATTGTYAEAVAAVLPCYWIYRDVGRELVAASSPDPMYKRWIEMYASEEFDAVVEAVLAVTDRIGDSIGPAERERCRRHFAATCRYEWMFWDAAYERLEWPLQPTVRPV
jgi:thiaminase (transcriptional activator TenA)